MNILFSTPLALLALSGLAALAAIYLFRNRFQRRQVSSLMLWQQMRKPRQGGLNLNRIQTPLLFFLELLALLFLGLAAAGPLYRSQQDTRIYAFVLDDSFSMRAGDPSAREKGRREIIKELEDAGRFRAHFLLAGQRPQRLGSPVESIPEAQVLLDRWECFSPVSQIQSTVNLAAQIGGRAARILVVTDHSPPDPMQTGRIKWTAFGQAQPNIAFINASRTARGENTRCMLALANLSDQSSATQLVLTDTQTGQTLMEESVELGPRQVERMILEPSIQQNALSAYITDQSLEMDNQVVLLPAPQRPIRVEVDITDEALADSVNQALNSIDQARLTAIGPELVIRDSISQQSSPDRWQMSILSDPNASAYIGPFILDRTSPLTNGLSLEGTIWAAASDSRISLPPVIAAGNTTLLYVQDSIDQTRNIVMRFNPQMSTLTETPNWPILFWNVVQWRKQYLPGMLRVNYSLGMDVSATLTAVPRQITISGPENTTYRIPPSTGQINWRPPRAGLYTIRADENNYDFAVNTLSLEESDLTRAQTGTWGGWEEAQLFWWEYRSISWLLILIVLGVMLLHLYLIADQKGAERI